MARVLVSGNLNVYGNAGQFETDRSTWGFADGNTVTTRTAAQKSAGLYGAQVAKSVTITDNLIIPCAWVGEIGKTYLVKAKVRTPTSNLIAAGADTITLRGSLSNLMFGLTEIDYVNKTVTNATDTWVDIEIAVECTSGPIGPYYGTSINIVGAIVLGGILYVDQFEVYEFIDDETPDPDPEDPTPEETDRVFHSKNPITLGKTATVGWELVDNYRLYNEVRVEDVADSLVYNTKIKLALYPETDGSATFYLREAFRGVFSFIPPTLQQNTVVRLTDRIKRFKNFSGDVAETEMEDDTLTESLPNLVLWGGINKFHFPGLNYFTDYLPTNKKFLTWAPVEKYADRLQEDYLNFWIYDDFAQIKVRLKVYFDDDTNETEVASTTACAYGQLFQIPAGPANSGAALVNPAKNATKYELTLLDEADVVISETRTYYITTVTHPLTRYFMFLNSLGAFEVLRFTGQAAETAEYKRDVVQKFLPHDYAALDGEFAVNSVLMEEKKAFSSGFIKEKLAAEWHEYLKDFMISPIIYDITDGQRYPVVITGGSHVREDQNYERFIRFEAREAYDNDSYTPATI